MRRGPGGPWSARVDAETGIWEGLGPGNTNVWVLGGWGRDTTHPVLPWLQEAGIPPSRYPPSRTTPVHPSSSPTGVFGSTKEILGVNNAHLNIGYRSGPHASPYARSSQHPSWALGRAVRLGLGSRALAGHSLYNHRLL